MSAPGWSMIGFLAGFALCRAATVFFLRRIAAHSAACGPTVRLPRDWAKLLQKRPRALRTLRLSGVVFASVDDLVDLLAGVSAEPDTPPQMAHILTEVAVSLGVLASECSFEGITLDAEGGQ